MNKLWVSYKCFDELDELDGDIQDEIYASS